LELEQARQLADEWSNALQARWGDLTSEVGWDEGVHRNVRTALRRQLEALVPDTEYAAVVKVPDAPPAVAALADEKVLFVLRCPQLTQREPPPIECRRIPLDPEKTPVTVTVQETVFQGTFSGEEEWTFWLQPEPFRVSATEAGDEDFPRHLAGVLGWSRP
jgi:hypothetical protein